MTLNTLLKSNSPHYSRGWQMFSGRNQIESILSCGGHTVSVTVQSSCRKAAIASAYVDGRGCPPTKVFMKTTRGLDLAHKLCFSPCSRPFLQSSTILDDYFIISSHFPQTFYTHPPPHAKSLLLGLLSILWKHQKESERIRSSVFSGYKLCLPSYLCARNTHISLGGLPHPLCTGYHALSST